MHGTDLRDLWRPGGGASRLTWRRLRVLVDGLPADSLTWSAVRDAMTDDELVGLSEKEQAGHGRWSRTELLLAAVHDQLADMRAEAPHVAGAPGDPKYPQPYPRPGVTGRDGVTPIRRDGDSKQRGITAEEAEMLLRASPSYRQDDNGDQGSPTE